MKKYIIKNADGSEQHVMEAVHASRKEAGQTLWDYLREHNDYHCLDSDKEGWASPFDFIVKEVECKDVNEVITDFESARKALGLETNDGFRAASWLTGEDALSISKVSRFVHEINPEHAEALIALNKLFTIAQAWNKEDGFVPDFSDFEQTKWFPWFKYDEKSAGFVCADSINSQSSVAAFLGSRLCFKSSERAEQFGKQFADLYNKVFL